MPHFLIYIKAYVVLETRCNCSIISGRSTRYAIHTPYSIFPGRWGGMGFWAMMGALDFFNCTMKQNVGSVIMKYPLFVSIRRPTCIRIQIALVPKSYTVVLTHHEWMLHHTSMADGGTMAGQKAYQLFFRHLFSMDMRPSIGFFMIPLTHSEDES